LNSAYVSHQKRRTFAIILVLLVLLLSFRPAAAHSEDAVLRLSNASAGPFTLNVWTYPSLLRPGSIHFSVSVFEAGSGEPVPVSVYVRATPLGEHNHAEPASSLAVLDLESWLYETNLLIQEPGPYQVTVQTTDADGRQGEAAFEIKVVSATGFKVLIVALIGQAGLFAVWLGKEGIRTWGVDRIFRKGNN
jgi:hypothetical protein